MTHASARFLTVEAGGLRHSSIDGITIDAADLRGAHIYCNPGEDYMACVEVWRQHFHSMAYADLRSATIPQFCCVSGLSTAKFDGLITELNFDQSGFQEIATAMQRNEKVTFTPSYFRAGARTTLTGEEIQQLATILDTIRAASIRPSFDCSRAQSVVDHAICKESDLATLDSALAWMWARTPHGDAERANQSKWLTTRAGCFATGIHVPESWVGLEPNVCLKQLYLKRIRELAPQTAREGIPDGTYVNDESVLLPRNTNIQLVSKYYRARGLRYDLLNITNW